VCSLLAGAITVSYAQQMLVDEGRRAAITKSLKYALPISALLSTGYPGMFVVVAYVLWVILAYH
jgi:hypothetical protein